MKKRLLVISFLGAGALSSAFVIYGQTAGQRGQGPSSPSGRNASQVYAEQRALLEEYCIECHNNKARTGNLSLQDLDITRVGDHRAEWEKVVKKLRTGMMPPPGQERPDPDTYVGFVTWLENELDRNAQPYTPAPGLHRLNRTEYGNAIQDLL